MIKGWGHQVFKFYVPSLNKILYPEDGCLTVHLVNSGFRFIQYGMSAPFGPGKFIPLRFTSFFDSAKNPIYEEDCLEVNFGNLKGQVFKVGFLFGSFSLYRVFKEGSDFKFVYASPFKSMSDIIGLDESEVLSFVKNLGSFYEGVLSGKSIE